MADARIESQSFPEPPPLMLKVIAAIKDWACRVGILGKEIMPLPPSIEYIRELRFMPYDPHPLTIWCEFPKGRDFFVLRSRTYVGAKNESRVTSNLALRRQFYDKILEFSLLSGLCYNYCPGGEKKFYWDFFDEFYFYGLTKDEFFRRYRKVGGIANYFISFFRGLFFKQEQDPATQNANSNLYL